MSKIIAVTAGKSGAGKSSVCANVAAGLAFYGKKTLVVELDFSLRCQDIILGVKDEIKYDIGQYLTAKESQIDILTAATKVRNHDKLHLICASRNPFTPVDADRVMSVCEELRKRFDYIVIDTGGSPGINNSIYSAAKAADLILMVTTPDSACVSESAILSDFLYMKKCKNQRLIINKVNAKPWDLDAVIDETGIQLIGVMPDDSDIKMCGAKGIPLPPNSLALKIYRAISERILGVHVPLAIQA